MKASSYPLSCLIPQDEETQQLRALALAVAQGETEHIPVSYDQEDGPRNTFVGRLTRAVSLEDTIEHQIRIKEFLSARPDVPSAEDTVRALVLPAIEKAELQVKS